MTRHECEREFKRLMAVLNGQGEALLIDEAGDATERIPADAPVPRVCVLCDVRLDDDEPVVQGYDVCEDCVPELEPLLLRQVVRLIYHGKRSIWHGVDRRWQDCEMCHGKGWIDGVVARWNGLL
jgi:hypothetical protein